MFRSAPRAPAKRTRSAAKGVDGAAATAGPQLAGAREAGGPRRRWRARSRPRAPARAREQGLRGPRRGRAATRRSRRRSPLAPDRDPARLLAAVGWAATSSRASSRARRSTARVPILIQTAMREDEVRSAPSGAFASLRRLHPQAVRRRARILQTIARLLEIRSRPVVLDLGAAAGLTFSRRRRIGAGAAAGRHRCCATPPAARSPFLGRERRASTRASARSSRRGRRASHCCCGASPATSLSGCAPRNRQRRRGDGRATRGASSIGARREAEEPHPSGGNRIPAPGSPRADAAPRQRQDDPEARPADKPAAQVKTRPLGAGLHAVSVVARAGFEPATFGL